MNKCLIPFNISKIAKDNNIKCISLIFDEIVDENILVLNEILLHDSDMNDIPVNIVGTREIVLTYALIKKNSCFSLVKNQGKIKFLVYLDDGSVVINFANKRIINKVKLHLFLEIMIESVFMRFNDKKQKYNN